MAPHAALARGRTTGLTCHRQPPGAVRCEEQGQAEDAGAHHAHPPELQAEQGRPRPQRGHAPRAHGAGATGVGRQRPGERRPGAQGAQRWKEAAAAFARRPPSGLSTNTHVHARGAPRGARSLQGAVGAGVRGPDPSPHALGCEHAPPHAPTSCAV